MEEVKRYCHTCKHEEKHHQKPSSDVWDRHRVYGECYLPNCRCINYVFDYERWIRDRERMDVLKVLGVTEEQYGARKEEQMQESKKTS